MQSLKIRGAAVLVFQFGKGEILSSDIFIIGAAILGILFTLAAAFGAYAVYRVNKQATALAEFKTNADVAEQNSRIWQNRSKATQAELDSTTQDLGKAKVQITDLRLQVEHLQGVVTAREEIVQLTAGIRNLSEVVKRDHELQKRQLDSITTAIGALKR
jgi:chromosome segregation ATPase